MIFSSLDRRQRRLLYTCFYAFFCSGFLSLALGSALPGMRASYGLSNTFSGLLLSAHSAGNLIAGVVSGVLTLYLGQKRTVVLLASMTYLGMLALTLQSAPALLLASCVLIGLGRGSITNFNTRTVNVLTDGSPAASNLLHAHFALGAIAAPMLFILLRREGSWKAGLIVVVLFGVLSVISYARAHIDEAPPVRRGTSAGSLVFLRDPAFLVSAMMMFCYLCSEYAINGWLVTYLQHRDGLLSPEDLAFYSQAMATLLWLVILVGRLSCATLSRYVPQKALLLISSVGASAFFVGMLWGGGIGTVTACVAGLGFCMAGVCPMIYSDAVYFTNNFPLATGSLFTIGMAGGVLMPFLIGVLSERFGFHGGMAAIAVTFGLLVVFAVINLFVRPRTADDGTGA